MHIHPTAQRSRRQCPKELFHAACLEWHPKCSSSFPIPGELSQWSRWTCSNTSSTSLQDCCQGASHSRATRDWRAIARCMVSRQDARSRERERSVQLPLALSAVSQRELQCKVQSFMLRKVMMPHLSPGMKGLGNRCHGACAGGLYLPERRHSQDRPGSSGDTCWLTHHAIDHFIGHAYLLSMSYRQTSSNQLGH